MSRDSNRRRHDESFGAHCRIGRVARRWRTGGTLPDYKATLARLAPLVEAANIVVPGHGSPHPRDTALRLMDEDLDYLDALERGEEKPALPAKRDTKPQRKIHAENLREVHGS